MSDIHGAPSARLLLARLDLQLDEQRLVLRKKDLRLRELDDEEVRVRADIEILQSRVAETTAERDTITDADATEALRLGITAEQLALQVKGKKIRLLELDEEREQIAIDKEASAAHITKLEAETAQQNERLKEPSSG